MSRFNRVIVTVLCAGIVLSTGSAALALAPPGGGRGSVVSVTGVAHLTAPQTVDYLATKKLTTPVRNGVDAYRISYRTITPEGRATTASGLIVLPLNSDRRLRAVVYEHGSLVLKSDAPSVNGDTRPDRARAMIFAAAGYAAIAPDYLGLGDGPGHHPYTHAASEVSASADLLTAARTVTARLHRSIDRRVMVTGFSQGGHAAMALGKALQAGAVRGYGLAALAPVSGPYDVAGVETPAGLYGRVGAQDAVFYFGYWLTSMNRIYHLYSRPDEAFQEPYAAKVTGLFDGYHNESAIATALPATPEQLVTQRFVAWAQHPTGALLRAMRESDGTCSWTPRVPVRLYAASADRNVPILNAEHCRQMFKEHGADVPLIDVGAVSHTDSVHVALPKILDWFERTSPPA